jgi:hypothetical protein
MLEVLFSMGNSNFVSTIEPYAELAMRIGKSVLVEKPLASTYEDAKALLKLHI